MTFNYHELSLLKLFRAHDAAKDTEASVHSGSWTELLRAGQMDGSPFCFPASLEKTSTLPKSSDQCGTLCAVRKLFLLSNLHLKGHSGSCFRMSECPCRDAGTPGGHAQGDNLLWTWAPQVPPPFFLLLMLIIKICIFFFNLVTFHFRSNVPCFY